MHPVAVTAVLLLVVLMSMSASAWSPELMCRTKYPATPCKNKFGEGWYQFGPNRCVKAFHNRQIRYRDAEYACRAYPKGHLVSIHNDRELDQVMCAMFRATPGKGHYWIGLFMRKGRFVWTDRSNTRGFSKWYRGQPSTNWFHREHCVEMNYGSWGRWNDAGCRAKRPFVCSAIV